MATIIKSSPQIKVKKEICADDNIKEFADQAMNDILGWYGYENVDRETRLGITLSGESSTIKLSSKESNDSSVTNKPKSKIRRHLNVVQQNNNKETQTTKETQEIVIRKSALNNQNGINLHGESSTSEKDSSRESSKSPLLMKMLDKQQDTTCTWCKRVATHSAEIIATPEGTVFCSESCFSQSRRASFKRAKTCDWCRHVRHAVSYVDFQDGASQLQFCSDKCLNQYKMQIFCNETQAHLDMNPHLKEKGLGSGSNLITPELWMRNCKSRSASPLSDRSLSLSPPTVQSQVSATKQLILSPQISPISVTSNSNATNKKPIISVAPPSKLLQHSLTRSPSKSNRKRRSGHRQLSSTVTSLQTVEKTEVNHNNNNTSILNNNNNILHKGCPTMPNVQDLRTSTGSNHQISAGPKFENNRDNLEPNRPNNNFHQQFIPPPPNLYPIRPPFMANARFNIPHTSQPPRPPLTHNNPNGERTSLFGIPAPPVTILVPYPIIIPLPIPIPIPLPLIDFIKAAGKAQSSKNVQSTVNENEPKVEQNLEEQIEEEKETNDFPLDFTTHHNNENSISEHGNEEPKETEEKQDYSVVDLPPKEDNPEQKLPKFKITRLNSKRTITPSESSETPIITSTSIAKLTQQQISSECSRPLRKRKRLIVIEDDEGNK